MLRALTILAALVLYAASLYSCNSGTKRTYTLRWNYDCASNGVPASFEYGVVTGSTFAPVGSLAVAACAGNQAFTASYAAAAAPAGTVYYVRAKYAGGVYSPAAEAQAP